MGWEPELSECHRSLFLGQPLTPGYAYVDVLFFLETAGHQPLDFAGLLREPKTTFRAALYCVWSRAAAGRGTRAA